VGAEVVTAAFYNFEPAMVAKAVPGCWEVVDPLALAAIRVVAGAQAIVEHAGATEADTLIGVLPFLRRAAAACPLEGRSLAGANQALWPALEGQMEATRRDLAEAWQACTTLREHRGDGHVAALVAHGLNGVKAHLLVVGCEDVPEETLRDNRGWTEQQWQQAEAQIVGRGLLESDGVATPSGRSLRLRVEALTDDLAEVPLAVLTAEERATLLDGLRQCAGAIQRSGLYPFPNPMGLPELKRDLLNS
jgi:hypothetical protein